jgi:ABC-2 type transport system ATP-binding protein
MIRVSDLRIDYDSVCAVRDVSFEVKPGEVCGLIGPNGAGKTSTMRALTGLLEPTYGEIEISGIDMREHPRDACRTVGFMPDAPPMYDDLLCWEFLDLFAASYGLARSTRREAIAARLAEVGLTGKRNAAIAGLSRGMRQRLMLAKTLLPEPQVLILDEPASGVDPQGRIDLKNVIKALSAASKTVLISSHILVEMTEFCTSVVIMEKGALVASGSIEDLRKRLMGAITLSIEVLGPPEDLERALGEDPHVLEVTRLNGVVRARFGGDREAAADLLARLVDQGIRVSAFARAKEGLEELFLKIGARELS